MKQSKKSPALALALAADVSPAPPPGDSPAPAAPEPFAAAIDPDMAFVLVQHLAPDHQSILSDLIRRYTRRQVFEVEDGMVVRPNCAFF